jgi:hypothetical protein
MIGTIAAAFTEHFAYASVRVGVLLLMVAVRVGSYYLWDGTIEHQRRGDTLVANDTVLETTQRASADLLTGGYPEYALSSGKW